MSIFQTTPGQDPFLHVHLERGEAIIAESDAMVMMEGNLDLVGTMRGGLVQSFLRRMANDESFFQQKMVAVRGGGDALLAHKYPGAIEVIELDGRTEYLLNDGTFIAADDSVRMSTRTQGLGNALFGGTGGFLVMHAAGQGKLAVGGFGDVFTIDVTPGTDVTIDNNHVVAWDNRLSYSMSASTRRSAGFLANLLNSQMTGEQFVTRFSGTGKVYLCSRNKIDFAAWIASMVPQRSS